ncbi:MAG: hypothetical protein NZ874_06830 [Fimbriimonadales bacterium]|nr:hypothetical protein [Fimbriimonadales bacterium]
MYPAAWAVMFKWRADATAWTRLSKPPRGMGILPVQSWRELEIRATR